MLPHAVASANGPITGPHPMAIIHVSWDRGFVLTFQSTFTMLLRDLSDAPARCQDNRQDSGCASRAPRIVEFIHGCRFRSPHSVLHPSASQWVLLGRSTSQFRNGGKTDDP